MKVLAINGSPHKNGNTAFAISVVLKELENEGIETEVIHIGNKPIRGCLACSTCWETKDDKCVIITDKVNEYIQKMKEADGIIFASPVHFASMSGALKSLMDRAFYVAGANGNLFRHKVAAGLLALRRGGAVAALDQILHYPTITEMIVVSGNYWTGIHGRVEGEAELDLEGTQTMRVLGRNMAWVLKLIEHGKDSVKEPAAEPKIMMNFIR